LKFLVQNILLLLLKCVQTNPIKFQYKKLKDAIIWLVQYANINFAGFFWEYGLYIINHHEEFTFVIYLRRIKIMIILK